MGVSREKRERLHEVPLRLSLARRFSRMHTVYLCSGPRMMKIHCSLGASSNISSLFVRTELNTNS